MSPGASCWGTLKYPLQTCRGQLRRKIPCPKDAWRHQPTYKLKHTTNHKVIWLSLCKAYFNFMDYQHYSNDLWTQWKNYLKGLEVYVGQYLSSWIVFSISENLLTWFTLKSFGKAPIRCTTSFATSYKKSYITQSTQKYKSMVTNMVKYNLTPVLNNNVPCPLHYSACTLMNLKHIWTKIDKSFRLLNTMTTFFCIDVVLCVFVKKQNIITHPTTI